jgi:RecA/RadA recombinase
MQFTSPLPLDAVIAAIQRRWGFKALHRAQDRYATPIHSLSTGYAALDALLLPGGFPCGQITELAGAATCGVNTLALKAVAQAQMRGQSAVYVDLDNGFDPDYGQQCGVDVAKLLIVRPRVPAQALEVALNLVHQGAGILVWDSVTSFLATSDRERLLDRALHRLSPLLNESPCVVLFLTRITSRLYQNGAPALQHHAALRLRLQATHWHRQHDLITGYDVSARVLRNRFGTEGDCAGFTVRL